MTIKGRPQERELGFKAGGQVEGVITFLDGVPLQWFIWMEDRYPFSGWSDFKIQIEERFGQGLSVNLMLRFLNILQERSPISYLEEFEKLSVYLPAKPDHIIEQTFIKGLKLEIQSELEKMNPSRLWAIMEAALKTEEQSRKSNHRSNWPSGWNQWAVTNGTA